MGMHNDSHAYFLTSREHQGTSHTPAMHNSIKPQKSQFWAISPGNPSPDD